MRKIFVVLSLLFGMIFVSGAATGEKWALGKYIKNGKVDTGNPRAMLNVRSGPGTSHDVAGTLKDGEAITVYAEKDGWVRITPSAAVASKPAASNEKWVLAKYIKRGKVSTGNPQAILNVRSGPGTNHDVAGTLKDGQTVTVYTQKDGWARISPSVAKVAVATSAKPEATKPEPVKEEWVLAKYIKAGKVSTGNPQAILNVRSGPGTNHDVAGTLKDGQAVTVYTQKDGWARISPSVAKVAVAISAKPEATKPEPVKEEWVLAKYIKAGKVNTGNPQAVLNIRSGPDTKCDVAGTLKDGQAVKAYAEKDGWIRINPVAQVVAKKTGSRDAVKFFGLAALLLLFLKEKKKVA